MLAQTPNSQLESITHRYSHFSGELQVDAPGDALLWQIDNSGIGSAVGICSYLWGLPSSRSGISGASFYPEKDVLMRVSIILSTYNQPGLAGKRSSGDILPRLTAISKS